MFYIFLFAASQATPVVLMISFIRLSYYPELASNTIGMHFPFFFIKQCKKVWCITKKRCTFNPKIT